MTTPTPRSREAEAFLETRQHTPAGTLSACDGWTAHEVTAHLAGIAVEVTRHLEPYLAGDPVPATRSFEEREAPLQALGDAELQARLEAEEARMRSVLDDVLEAEPGAVIPWTGRQMVAAKFRPHLRNEFAIHRWDVAGDDEVSAELLGQPDLVEHAVGVLGEILTRRGRRHDPAPGEDLRVRLRSAGAPDVLLVVAGDRAALELAAGPGDEPWLELDAAARTLFIWGRRPDGRGRVVSHADRPTLARLQALLAGY